MNILTMSLQGAALIAIAVIVRALAFGRLPSWSFQALWGVAVARLLIPFDIASPWSAYGALRALVAALSPSHGTIGSAANAAPYAPLVGAYPLETIAGAPASRMPAAPFPAWTAAWLAGAALLLAYFLIAHIRQRRRHARAHTIDVRRASRLPLSRLVRIRTTPRIDAPLTYGLFRPVVLLPEGLGDLGTRHARHILQHEFTHIRQGDILKKWLLVACLCLHWFNPLVWVLFLLANRDIELHCDETVLRALGTKERRHYAAMLLDMEEARSAAFPLASHFCKNAIEERIRSIMTYRRTTRIAVLAAAVLVCGTTTAFATNALPNIAADKPRAAVSQNAPGTPDQRRALYAKYTTFGLHYDAATDRMTYDGQLVRHFEDGDMVRNADGTYTGTLTSHQTDEGAIDVYAVRDADRALTGLRVATQQEFDERTQEMLATTSMPGVPSSAHAQQLLPNDGSASGSGDAFEGVEWWTAADFQEYLDRQRAELPQLIGERAYNPTDGWYTWTQERVDEAIARYEDMLRDIQNGTKISRFDSDGDSNIIYAYTPGEVTTDSDASYSRNPGTLPVDPSESTSTDANAQNSAANAPMPAAQARRDDNGAVSAPNDADRASYAANAATSSDAAIAVNASPAAVAKTTMYTAVIALPDGSYVNLGSYDTVEQRLADVRDFCAKRVAKGALTQAQSDAIIARYE